MINYLDRIKNKKVVITGGLGFVGHNLAKTLLEKYNCDVTIVDDCSNSNISIINDIVDRITFHKIDVLDTLRLFPLLEKTEFIFHLACKQISSSGKEPINHLRVNSESTLRILEYIRNNNLTNLKRFVYTSSASVYGSTTRLPLNEQDPTFVLSNYAATKLLGENYTIMYNRNYDIPTSCVRYSNIYGYGQSPNNPYCGVLGKFVHNALTNKKLNIFGDGEQTRDYTFIDDAIDATILAAIHPRALGDLFNVGTSVETSVNNLVDIISSNIKNLEIEYIQERDIDNIRRRAIDIQKIHQALTWSPKFNIKQGIKKTLDWYKKHLRSSTYL